MQGFPKRHQEMFCLSTMLLSPRLICHFCHFCHFHCSGELPFLPVGFATCYTQNTAEHGMVLLCLRKASRSTYHFMKAEKAQMQCTNGAGRTSRAGSGKKARVCVKSNRASRFLLLFECLCLSFSTLMNWKIMVRERKLHMGAHLFGVASTGLLTIGKQIYVRYPCSPKIAFSLSQGSKILLRRLSKSKRKQRSSFNYQRWPCWWIISGRSWNFWLALRTSFRKCHYTATSEFMDE